MPTLGRQGPPGRLGRITALQEGDDGFRARILPAGIVDRHEVIITSNADRVKDGPCLIEERVLRMRWRQRDLDGLLTLAAPAALLGDERRVGETPADTPSAFTLGMRSAPVPNVVGPLLEEAPAGFADLGATPIEMALPISALPLTSTCPDGVEVTTAGVPGLVNAEAETVGKGPTTGRASFFRHGLRWLAPRGHPPGRDSPGVPTRREVHDHIEHAPGRCDARRPGGAVSCERSVR